uniref:Uncharacterized protein n=1 Tax=Timspurckia oligopyrenoides TaxID=708627 RepID=A0A7S0ZGJ7_9RHOD
MGGEDGDFFDWDPNAIGDGEENGAGGDEEEELNVVVDEKVIRDGQKKVGFVQRIKEKRRVKRQMNFDLAIPFYMRRVGDGYVTALEVVMRRIHAALFSDESIRRLGAAEAAMHLGRAKLYSDSEEDRMRYQIAKDSMYNQRPKDVTNLDASAGGSNAEASAATSQPKSKKKNQSSLLALAAPPEPDNLKNPSSNAKNSISSGSLLASTNSVNSVQSIQNGGLGFVSGNASQEQNEVNVLEPLVLPLKELMDEDLSMAVRAEAATALVFFIAAGAGLQVFAREVQAERERKFNSTEPEELAQLEYENVYSAAGARKSSCVLVRYFGAFLADSQMGRGTGLVAARRLMDALLYEILEESPWLAIDAVELAEWWAMRHPLPSPTGALGLFWEALLSVGTAEAARAVGASVTRCLLVDPSRERVAVAAAVFLRRRILDIAVLSVDGAAQQLGASGAVFPEPLPAAIGTEVERYMSALWQALVLGPSAETRSACVAALGGGAALAGEPFRIATYERLCEVVRARGYGLRIDSQRVLDGLDSMYHARERLGEARSNAMRMQTGANQNKWLQGVWKLAAQSACAAQVLLGCPPPPGWEPLGPEGSADVINAEARFGNYRLREVRMASGLDDDNLRPIAEYMPQYAYDNLPPPPPPSLSQNNTQNQKPPEISGLKIN